MRRALTDSQGAPSSTCSEQQVISTSLSQQHLPPGAGPYRLPATQTGFSDVSCEQLCSKTLCKGFSATTAAEPAYYSGY